MDIVRMCVWYHNMIAVVMKWRMGQGYSVHLSVLPAFLHCFPLHRTQSSQLVARWP